MSQNENNSPKPGGHSRLFAMVAVVGIAAAFFLATYLSGFITAKADLTENKIYTVSEGTKEILSDLPVEVKLRYYVSSDKDGLPPQTRDYARRFGDLLREYERLSDGKLKVETLDPSPDTDEEDSAIADGVSPSVDQFTQNQYYFSVVLTSLGQIVALPPIDQVPEPTLEYLLTKAINEVTTLQDSKPKLTVVSGVPLNGNAMQNQQGYYLFAELSRRFSIDYVDPTDSSLVTADENGDKEDPAAVIVVHPHNITEEMEFEIDQYVLRGGRVLAFVDPAFYFAPRGGQPQFPGAPATPSTPQKSDLPSLFKAWGINYSDDRFVADMVFKTPIGMPDDTPIVLTLSEEALDPDDPVISQISNAFLILTGSLDGTAPKNINREVLLHSSDNSQLVVDRMDPSQMPPGSPPPPTLRTLNPQANSQLVTGFQAGFPGIIPRTRALQEPGIVGSVKSPDVPRKLAVITYDAEGDDLEGSVSLVGTDTKGTQITERVTVGAGEDVNYSKNIFAAVTSVSHDFGKTADQRDALDIRGLGVEHPLAVRLTGKFATAFPDGRPDPPAPSAPGAGGLPPGFPGGGGGLPFPGGPRGVEGDQGEGGDASSPAPETETDDSAPAPAPTEPEPAGEIPAEPAPETTEPSPPKTDPAPVPSEENPAAGGTDEPKPDAPDAPEAPDTPAEPDKPTTPAPTPDSEDPKPAEPESPEGETKPDKPATPDAATPDGDKGEPGEPETPTVPVPEIPETPPVDPETPSEPEVPALKEAEKEGVVVVVADVDMIQNQFTATVERRLVPPGNIVDVMVPNRQLGNLSFALNLVEQLTGDTRLLAVRSRSASSRPFTRIREIETEANKEMIAMEAEAQKDIANFVSELQALEQEKGADDQANQLVVQKQEEKIQSVNSKLVAKRKELRELQKAKKSKTESLIAKIKAWNILAVPICVILIGLMIAVIRRFMTAAR